MKNILEKHDVWWRDEEGASVRLTNIYLCVSTLVNVCACVCGLENQTKQNQRNKYSVGTSLKYIEPKGKCNVA